MINGTDRTKYRRDDNTCACLRRFAREKLKKPAAIAGVSLCVGVGVGVAATVAITKPSQATLPSNPPKQCSKLLPIIDHRDDFAQLLKAEKKTIGLEVGVQKGHYSERMLSKWTNCEKYIMMDPWKRQEHFQDGANVNNDEQEKRFQETKARTKPFEAKGVELEYIRDFSSEGVHKIEDESLDFIYIDARHDYRSMQEDLLIFWPKLKEEGIFAGHDFENADEVGRWCLYEDGTKCEDGKAVKAAVEEFAEAKNKQVVVPRRENKYVSWYMRK